MTLRGRLTAEPRSSIWYGCVIDGADHEIALGARSNVQDNTRVVCASRRVQIGADTTIGHNALLVDCAIGDRSLIGIGSQVAEGTVVANDVLLAAGSRTQSGQTLTSGWLWGGRPARPLKPLDKRVRTMMASIIETYQTYAEQFELAERAVASREIV